MVPEEGVEPTRPCGHRILSPARLPVPPLRELLRLTELYQVPFCASLAPIREFSF